MASNWRAEGTLRDYLVSNRIVAIADIDTRALTRLLRSGGVMRGVIATGDGLDPAGARRAGADAPDDGRRPTWSATSRPTHAFDWPTEDPDEFGVAPERQSKRRLKIAAYDFGMKWNILRRLSAHGCDVRVYPGDDARVRAARDEPGRRVPEQRPGRSGAARLRRSTTRSTLDRRRTCRSSASVSAIRFSAWRWAARPSS